MNTILENIIKSDKKIDVVGDIVVDEYFEVNSERISPEFPIPIYQSNKEKAVNILPGGAGNVANQLKKFNKLNNLYSVCSKKYKYIFNKLNLITSNEYVDLIPRKIRLYHKDFPLFRWDIENKIYNTDYYKLKLIIECILEKFKESNCEFSILSDYNKGFWGFDLDYKKYYNNKKTIVDPKKINNYNLWKKCYLFKPNYKEAVELTGGLLSWENQIDFFIKTLKCKYVVITDSSNGVYYNIGNKKYEFKNKYLNENVKSVIGAGDCFISALSSSLSSGNNILNSIDISCLACSKYISNKYNMPINLIDLNIGKVINNLDFFNNRDYKICFTNGCFDILHESHLELIKYCKKYGYKVVIGLNSDSSIKRIKGDLRPINDVKYRAKMLEFIQDVDYICIFNEETPLELIKKIKPELLVKGGDYTKELLFSMYGKYVKNIEIFPYSNKISTTKIIEKIKKNI